MKKQNFIELSLFISVLLSGFYAGTGFFVAMGGNPAITLMSDRTFAEFWQHTDHFMAARMQVFGPLLMLTLLVSVLLLVKQYHRLSFWLMLTALVILVADVAFIFSANHPLNHLVQSWSLDSLPANVSEVKWEIVKAFNVRIVFMISTFVMVLLASRFYNLRPVA